jgi:hypothetical protein
VRYKHRRILYKRPAKAGVAGGTVVNGLYDHTSVAERVKFTALTGGLGPCALRWSDVLWSCPVLGGRVVRDGFHFADLMSVPGVIQHG